MVKDVGDVGGGLRAFAGCLRVWLRAAIGVGLMVSVEACTIGNPSYNGGASTATSQMTRGSMTGTGVAASDSAETSVISESSASASGMTGGQTTGPETTGPETTGTTTGPTLGSTTMGSTTTGSTTGGLGSAFCDEVEAAAEELLMTHDCEEMSFNDQKIFVCQKEKLWIDAKGVCEEFCGRLVIAKSEEKRLGLHELLSMQLDSPKFDHPDKNQPDYPTASVWVGAYNTEYPWEQFYWIGREAMPSTKGKNGWGSNDPSANGQSAVVLAIFGPENLPEYQEGRWFDREEDLMFIFVCESLEAPTE